ARGIGPPRRVLLGTLLEALPGPDVDELVRLLADERRPEPGQPEPVLLPLVDGEAAAALDQRGQLSGGDIVAAQFVEHRGTSRSPVRWRPGYHCGTPLAEEEAATSMPEIVKTRLADGIFLLQFDTQYGLAATFLRVQEHYESSRFSGRVFTLEQYMD